MKQIYLRWSYVVHALAFHAFKHRYLYVFLIAAYLLFKAHFTLAINVSESLPNKAFLVSLDQMPSAPGQYVAFKWGSNDFYKQGTMMVKIVGGTTGQTVTVSERVVFVDGQPVGFAKSQSKHGTPLSPIPATTIPANKLFVKAPHPDRETSP